MYYESLKNYSTDISELSRFSSITDVRLFVSIFRTFRFTQVQFDIRMWVVVLQGSWLPRALPLYGLHSESFLQEGRDDQTLQGEILSQG